MTDTKLGNSDIWDFIKNIADAGNKIADAYDNLVKKGVITPGPGYVPPTPPPTVTPAVTPTAPSILQKPWFLPTIIGCLLYTSPSPRDS